mgnify:CR=1 FL=1
MQMEWENPLCFNFKPCLKLNEKILQTTHGCAVSFNPCLPDGVINELEAKWAIDHYGLDSTYGWVICRDVFPWGTKHHPEINKHFSYNGAATRTSSRLTFQSSRTRRFIYVFPSC